MIPQATIEQVAAASDVVEVIGKYVHLKRAGSAYKGLCPFHNEKSPSFTVNPGRQSFKCFGCGVGGTVFKFIEMKEGLNFPEAVKHLAEKAGIAVIEEGWSGTPGEEARAGETRRRLRALHKEAAEWFHRNLRKSNEAAAAREYLKSRGLTAEVAARWQIGYAPDSFDACLQWGASRGYAQELLVLGGLVKARDAEEGGGGSYRRQSRYDRFRDRLMFPICNDQEEVIAFSGRILKADARGAKYVNSPETPIFTKGKVLFGLHLSRRAILDEGFAIVCEGQIDLITAFEAGVRNVVAPQGTAFTSHQARLLKRQADEAVLCFDADAAGQQAAERSLPALLDAGVIVRVATMPPGQDPDSLIRQEGVEAFAMRIGMAPDFFDFQIHRLAGMFDLDTPKGKSLFARRMAESVVLVTDPVMREAVAAKVSSRLQISRETFGSLLKDTRRTARRDDSPPDLTGTGQPAKGSETPAPPVFEKPPVAVANLLKLALGDSAARAWLSEQTWAELLPKLPGTESLHGILSAGIDPDDVATVNGYLATLPAAEESFLSGLLAEPPFAKPMLMAQESWNGLARNLLKDRLSGVINRMRVPGLSVEASDALQKELLDLQRTLTDIGRL